MPDGAVARSGVPADLPRIAEIQDASPEASRWEVKDYLAYDLRVIEWGGSVAGFAVVRQVCAGECELLNIAVDPACRGQGLGKRLLEEVPRRHPGVVYLEVRESNVGARNFYKCFGFEEVGKRPGYYQIPPEGAIVMKYCSC